jgi:hypothetical protein
MSHKINMRAALLANGQGMLASVNCCPASNPKPVEIGLHR